MAEFIMQETEEMKTFGSVWKRYEPVAVLVRCKDCKHRPKEPDLETYKSSFDLEFPDSRCPCECADGFYSWYPDDNWFCGNGERKG